MGVRLEHGIRHGQGRDAAAVLLSAVDGGADGGLGLEAPGGVVDDRDIPRLAIGSPQGVQHRLASGAAPVAEGHRDGERQGLRRGAGVRSDGDHQLVAAAGGQQRRAARQGVGPAQGRGQLVEAHALAAAAAQEDADDVHASGRTV